MENLHLGLSLAVTMFLHDIPEGLGIGLPLRIRGKSFWKATLLSFWQDFQLAWGRLRVRWPAAFLILSRRPAFHRPAAPCLSGAGRNDAGGTSNDGWNSGKGIRRFGYDIWYCHISGAGIK